MTKTFANLGLSAPIVKALAEKGYDEPTPIQLKAIPVVMEGRDVIAAAQTGTGKTAAFTLPIMHELSKSTSGKRQIKALILTPTRELAAQIQDNLDLYGKHLPLKNTVLFGGVKANPQIRALRAGIDILVATPGRLLDLCNQGICKLDAVQMLVLDEADRMLDMGFVNDIRKIVKLLPKKRQNLLFSATFSKEIRVLTREFLNDPVSVEVASKNAAAQTVKQRAYRCDGAEKANLAVTLIAKGKWEQVLIFTRTKHGADRLTKHLNASDINAAAIHGNKSQNARVRALDDFKAGRVRVLVATDIAARGIDISQLPHVMNYELPNVPADYVHRIGRTGRAGQEGEAVSLVSDDERAFFKDIEHLIGQTIKLETRDGYEPRQWSDRMPSTNEVQKARDARRKEALQSRGPRPPRNGGGGRGGAKKKSAGKPKNRSNSDRGGDKTKPSVGGGPTRRVQRSRSSAKHGPRRQD